MDRVRAAMGRALFLANRAREDGDVPVGAVVIDSLGTIIGQGWNCREVDHDPSAHAEIVAMREAGARLGRWNLLGCTLVVTLEPCTMCAGAAVQARVDRVVFGAWDPKAGAAGSVRDVLRDARLNHQVEVIGGVLEEEASIQLRAFFSDRRDASPVSGPAARVGASAGPAPAKATARGDARTPAASAAPARTPAVSGAPFGAPARGDVPTPAAGSTPAQTPARKAAPTPAAGPGPEAGPAPARTSARGGAPTHARPSTATVARPSTPAAGSRPVPASAPSGPARPASPTVAPLSEPRSWETSTRATHSTTPAGVKVPALPTALTRRSTPAGATQSEDSPLFLRTSKQWEATHPARDASGRARPPSSQGQTPQPPRGVAPTDPAPAGPAPAGPVSTGGAQSPDGREPQGEAPEPQAERPPKPGTVQVRRRRAGNARH